MWGADVVGAEEQDYCCAHANAHRDTFNNFLPAYAILAKWCAAVARGPRNDNDNQ